jgi:hypothetical protein
MAWVIVNGLRRAVSSLMIQVSSDVTPCRLVSNYRRFEGSSILVHCWTLKMTLQRLLETSVTVCYLTCNMRKDWNVVVRPQTSHTDSLFAGRLIDYVVTLLLGCLSVFVCLYLCLFCFVLFFVLSHDLSAVVRQRCLTVVTQNSLAMEHLTHH